MTEAIKGIIAQLEHQKAAIDRALAALREVEGVVVPSPRRNLRATAEKIKLIVASKKAAPKQGTITPEGRQKLADAMKKRWAVKRANSVAKKKVVKKAK